MNILIFIRCLAVGGTERQVPLLARGLAARGHQVTIAQFYSGGAMEAALAESDVRLVSLGKTGRWDNVGPLWRLRQLLLTEQPDVLYSFLPLQNALAALLRPRALNTRLVFGIRASGMELAHYDRLSALSYSAEVWLARYADAIVANAECFVAGAAARGFPAGRIVVVQNGIDTEIMRPDAKARQRQRQAWNIDDRTFVVGMVARLDPMKDHLNFIAAAAQFVKQAENAHFICVGGGSTEQHRETLLEAARKHGIATRLSFVGEQKDAVSAYNAFDIATLSSAFGEGFSNAIGEAMACGVPVVATDVGDARKIIGDFGIVVPPRRPDLLAAGWRDLQCRRMAEPGLGGSARAHIVRNFAVAPMVERTERVLAQVCAGNLSH